MSEENEYEIEEGSTTRFFFITRQKGDAEEEFTVEQIHFANQDTTEYCIYNAECDEELDPDEKEHKVICAVISKYLEKKEQTIEIEVKGGTVVDVRNLPEGLDYEVIDRDVMEEENGNK